MRIARGIIGWSNWRSGCEFYEDTTAEVHMRECSGCDGTGKATRRVEITTGSETQVVEPGDPCDRCNGTSQVKVDTWPRWLPRRRGNKDDPAGALLTDALNDPEGARVVVVVLPRTASDEEVEQVEALLLRDGEDGLTTNDRLRSFFVSGFVAGLEHAVDNDGWEGAAKDVAAEAWGQMFGDSLPVEDGLTEEAGAVARELRTMAYRPFGPDDFPKLEKLADRLEARLSSRSTEGGD